MELEFEKTVYPCLQQVKWETQNSEQTQEIRLEDEMPDVGSVLGTWGQVLLRGKNWRTGEMQVSAGVMVWVLYAPEDGSEPRCVETWIPIQLRWDLPDTERDGAIITSCLLRDVDARVISARRLLVRVGVGMLAEAVAPGQMETFAPAQLPEDVQVRTARYPVELAAEAGEKPFALEEELRIPSGMPEPVAMIAYTLCPRITESKVLAGKVVFRGVADTHVLYKGTDGRLYSADMELPFSQYAELEQDYDSDASVRLCCQVTGLEISLQDGKWIIKAGITAQYVIYHRPVIQVVEDAYSITREAEPIREEMPVTIVLDRVTQMLTARQTVSAEVGRVVDVSVLADHGTIVKNDGGVEITVPGMCQLLYEDSAGELQSITAGWSESWDLPASSDSQIYPYVGFAASPQMTVGAGSVALEGYLQMEAVAASRKGLQLVRGMSLGAQMPKDPDRPSLILCRCGNRTLWQIAKDCHTTVEAICQANGIEESPVDDTMVLIPIP